MLYKHFYEVTKEARKYFKIVKKQHVMEQPLNEKNIFKLKDSGLNFLEVSIDGFDNEANMKLRGAHEEKIIKSLEFLSKNTDIPLQINTVVSRENYNSLWGAIEKLKKCREYNNDAHNSTIHDQAYAKTRYKSIRNGKIQKTFTKMARRYR